MDCKKIGAFICSLRKEKGLTQAALGDKLGISNRAISKWENGDGLPDISILCDVANTLGVTVDELLKGEKSAPITPEIKVTEVQGKDNINNIFQMLYITSLFFASFGAILGAVTEIYSIWAFRYLFYTHWEIIFVAVSFTAIVISALVLSLATTRLQVSHTKDEIIKTAGKKCLLVTAIISVLPAMFILRIVDVTPYSPYVPVIGVIIFTALALIFIRILKEINNKINNI